MDDDFDIIIDDGSHKLEDMVFVIKEYINKLSKNGILIIEDLQSVKWADELDKYIPETIKNKTKHIDLTKTSSSQDNILYIIDLL